MSGAQPAAPSRRHQILEALAERLEKAPDERITTAGLARAVGVSEAALYRHFPSKARMFEGLIEFAEKTLFTRIGVILEEDGHPLHRCERILHLLLLFAQRNPGISRILVGDALGGETPRLHKRVEQLFRRIETQLKQILREGEIRGELPPLYPCGPSAGLLLAVAVGRLHRFVHSGFTESPSADWDRQWTLLQHGVLPR